MFAFIVWLATCVFALIVIVGCSFDGGFNYDKEALAIKSKGCKSLEIHVKGNQLQSEMDGDAEHKPVDDQLFVPNTIISSTAQTAM